MDIPEIALEVLARLPLKSIGKFRSVKKEWKLLIDSDYFRDHFLSLNSSSSVSWSIIQTRPQKLTLEIVGHHGCRVLGLTQSPGSLVSFFLETTIRKVVVLACTDGLVLIYAETNDRTPMFYIGNPLLREWFRVPLHNIRNLQDLSNINGSFKDVGLVTKVKSGMVVSYKIVVSLSYSGKVDFMIYSSDTEMWEVRFVTCRHSSNLWYMQEKSIALNGILHWLSNRTSSIVAYNFYGGYNDGVDDDKCRVIHFPGNGKDERFCRSFTTSEGFIVYFNEFDGDKKNRTLRVWRLVKYTDVVAEAWQLFWEVNLMSLVESGIDYFPVVMHPLKSEIIYLWSRNKKSLILFNLRTHVFSLHKEGEDGSKCMDGCVLSFNDCSEYMEKIYGVVSSVQGGPSHLIFAQYVLPRWFHHLPCHHMQPS
ncbi:putative F-box protein [Cardamine amara subsp. amara]|uniref:F-box protein n=1 Tax=Cardamine amara subsp. amara TaxID=228776 RepID=A0ABD0Z718_CARAN